MDFDDKISQSWYYLDLDTILDNFRINLEHYYNRQGRTIYNEMRGQFDRKKD